MGIVTIFFLLLWGGACYGLWKLLHTPAKPIEHFVCSVYRSTYPPHPEDWAITHRIRVFRGLLWLLFGITAFSAFLSIVGVLAAIGLMFTH